MNKFLSTKISETGIVLLLVLVLLLGVARAIKNVLTDFFYWEITKTSQAPMPDVYQTLVFNRSKPLRKWGIEELRLQSKSALSADLNKGKTKILFSENASQILPIASLTKLMTACIVLENYDLSQRVTVSQKATEQDGKNSTLKPGTVFTAENLLFLTLMESSNGAAYALAEAMGERQFVDLMNKKADELGLKNTVFFNATGLDPEAPLQDSAINYSTADDLLELTIYLLKKPLIWEILRTPSKTIISIDGSNFYQVKNTNELLGTFPEILGGKTGWTLRAKGCLVLVLKNRETRGYLVNVILGSDNRFEEMKKMVDWVYASYEW